MSFSSPVDVGAVAGSSRFARADLALACVIAAATFAIFSDALEGWWLNDDPQVLVHAVTHSPGEVLFAPHAWRLLSTSNFTPLVTLSFQFDHALAGAAPSGFYLHQLISLGIGVGLLFLLLRSYLPLSPAVAAVVLVVALPPVWLASRTLMVRHYVEGFVFAGAALVAWHRFTRDRRWTSGGVAAFFYLAASLAKEVYFPLPLLFIAQSRAAGVSAGRIVRDLVPAGVTAAAVLIWRTVMLGSRGGYGALRVAEVLALPQNLLREISPDRSLTVAGVVLLLVATALIVSLASRHFAMVAFVALFALAPLAAVATQLEGRHSFVPVITAVSAAALALGRRWPRAGAAVLTVCAVVAATSGVAGRALVKSAERAAIAEGRYVAERPSASPPLLARSTGWYLTGLDALRRLEGGGAAPPFVLSIEGAVLKRSPRFVAVDSRSSRVAPLPDEERRRIEVLRSARNSALAIEATLFRSADSFAWQLEPRSGPWKILTLPHFEDYEVPPAGERRIPAPAGVEQVQVWRGGEGGWDVSPPIVLRVGHRLFWSDRSDAGGKLNLWSNN